MGYDRGDSFPFDFEQNGIPFGSKFQMKFHLVQKCKENGHHNHILFYFKGIVGLFSGISDFSMDLEYSNSNIYMHILIQMFIKSTQSKFHSKMNLMYTNKWAFPI